MRRIGPGITGALPCLLLGLLVISGCRGAEAAARARPVAPPIPVRRGDTIELPQDYAARTGIVVATSSYADMTPIVHATGVLEFDAQRLAAVGSRIAGRVVDVDVIDGSRVEAGEVLATIESAELGAAQADITAMEALLLAARRDVERKQSLLAEGITSQREVDLALTAATIAGAQLRAAKQRVVALAGSPSKGKLGVTALTSPIAGDVVGVHVSRGQAVVPSHTAFVVSDRRSLWVRLAIFEGDVRHIHPGDPVELRPTAGPGETFAGVVEVVGAALDPMTRSADVRVTVDNSSGRLRAGQTVEGNIRPLSTQRRAVVVARPAVIQVDGVPTVFVAQGERTFKMRRVTLGIGDGESIEIREGLAGGERVVVAGVFALKGELFR